MAAVIPDVQQQVWSTTPASSDVSMNGFVLQAGDEVISGSGTQKLTFAGQAWSTNVGTNADGMCMRLASRNGNLKSLMITDPYYNNTLLNNPGLSVLSDRDNLRIAVGATNTAVNNTVPLNCYASMFQPYTDNAPSLGSSVYRWTTVYATTGTINTSDARLKTDVSDSELGLEFVERLRPVSYRWIEGEKRVVGIDASGVVLTETVPGLRKHYGFISQEVKEALDQAGVDAGMWVLADKGDSSSTQMLRYEELIAPLVKAVQELSLRVKVLESGAA